MNSPMSIRQPTDKLIRWPWKKLPFSDEISTIRPSCVMAGGAGMRAYLRKNLSERLIRIETTF